MKFICKELSSKTRIYLLKTLLLSIILTSICALFLPTVSVESLANEQNVVVETLDKFNVDHIKETNVQLHKNTLNRNLVIDMKQIEGNGQSIKWIDEVLERVNIVIDKCKGQFTSFDMIMPLNLNSNQWINH